MRKNADQDFLKECMGDMGNKIPIDEFNKGFCIRCNNSSCTRSKTKGFKFVERANNWKSMYFDDVKRANEKDPKYEEIRSKKFISIPKLKNKTETIVLPSHFEKSEDEETDMEETQEDESEETQEDESEETQKLVNPINLTKMIGRNNEKQIKRVARNTIPQEYMTQPPDNNQDKTDKKEQPNSNVHVFDED